MAGHAVNRKRLATLSAAAFFLCLSGVSPAAPPQRVVSTNLCTDEYVFRLVPRNHIAALSYEATDRHPVVSTIADQARGIPTIHPSVETVITLHPDLVVMYAGTENRLRRALLAEHIPVLDVPWDNTLDDIRKTTKMLGGKLGAPREAAAMLARMDRTLADAQAKAPARKVRVLFYQPNGYVMSGFYVDQILSQLGGTDMAAALHPGRSGTVPVEQVLSDAPDLLLLGSNSDSSLAARPLHHPALKALKHTLITTLDTRALLCPGPWVADAAAPLGVQIRQAARLRASADTLKK